MKNKEPNLSSLYVYNQFSFENLIVYTRYIKYEAKAENTTDIASKIYTGTRINAQ